MLYSAREPLAAKGQTLWSLYRIMAIQFYPIYALFSSFTGCMYACSGTVLHGVAGIHAPIIKHHYIASYDIYQELIAHAMLIIISS